MRGVGETLIHKKQPAENGLTALFSGKQVHWYPTEQNAVFMHHAQISGRHISTLPSGDFQSTLMA